MMRQTKFLPVLIYIYIYIHTHVTKHGSKQHTLAIFTTCSFTNLLILSPKFLVIPKRKTKSITCTVTLRKVKLEEMLTIASHKPLIHDAQKFISAGAG